jgi:GPH family glycoside/pentoside/hexuronide:cation symporter
VVYSLAKTLGGLIGTVFFVKILTAFSGGVPNQYTQKGFTLACLVLCIICVITILITVFSTKERVKDVVISKANKRQSFRELLPSFKIIISDKRWDALIITQILALIGTTMSISGATYYSMYVLKDMGNMSWLAATVMIPSLFIQFLSPLLMTKMTKKRIFVGGTILYCIGCLGFAFVSPLVPGMIVFNLVKSIGIGLYGSVTVGIVADLVSNTKKKTGRFIPGAGFAGLSAATKLGQGLGNVLLGLMLSAAGLSKSLDPSAASPEVVTAVSWIFLWLPLICGIIAAVLFQIFYDLDEDKDVA